MKEIRELTKAEDQLMRILWQLKTALVKEIADHMPEPKPAYTTIATVLKVMKSKGFVDYKATGNTYVYYPLISEEEYTRFAFNKVFSNYFSGSYQRLVSFLAEEKGLDGNTREELLKLAGKLKSK